MDGEHPVTNWAQRNVVPVVDAALSIRHPTMFARRFCSAVRNYPAEFVILLAAFGAVLVLEFLLLPH